MIVPWYLIENDLALIRLLCWTERETINTVENLIVIGSLYLSTTVHRISSIILNSFSTLFILYILSHILTCAFTRIYPQSDMTSYDIYIAYHYYVYTTVSTVGYGDITLKSFSEEDNSIGQLLIMIMVIVFGLNYYALIQGKIRKIFNELVALESYRNKEIEGMEDWMIQRNVSSAMTVPFKFEKKFKELFTYSLSFDIEMLINLNGFIDMISFSQKQEILESVSTWYIKKFRYFEGVSIENSIRMVTQLKPSHFLNGDKIIGKGHESTGIYFVLQGKVMVMDVSQSLQVFKLGEGQIFGDFCHLNLESQFDYIAQGECYCLFLDDQVMNQILDENYLDLAFLRFNCNERWNEFAAMVGAFMKFQHASSNIASEDTNKINHDPKELKPDAYAGLQHMIQSSESERVWLALRRELLTLSKERTTKYLMRDLVFRWYQIDKAKEDKQPK